MSSKHEQSTSEAFVLHSKPYQENSLILDVFSEKHGHLALIAKGVKKSTTKSKQNQSYLLQPFALLNINYLLRQNLSILTQTEQIKSFTCRENKILYCCYYLNELLVRLLPIQENFSSIFRLYQATIEHLFQLSTETLNMSVVELSLRRFEIQLLNLLGYNVDLFNDAKTGLAINPLNDYSYIQDLGFVDCNILKLNQNISAYSTVLNKVSGKALIDLSSNNFAGILENKIYQREIKMLLRSLLALHLGDKPLRSRKVFQQLFPF